jgi:hypothetical protein
METEIGTDIAGIGLVEVSEAHQLGTFATDVAMEYASFYSGHLV